MYEESRFSSFCRRIILLPARDMLHVLCSMYIRTCRNAGDQKHIHPSTEKRQVRTDFSGFTYEFFWYSSSLVARPAAPFFVMQIRRKSRRGNSETVSSPLNVLAAWYQLFPAATRTRGFHLREASHPDRARAISATYAGFGRGSICRQTNVYPSRFRRLFRSRTLPIPSLPPPSPISTSPPRRRRQQPDLHIPDCT